MGEGQDRSRIWELDFFRGIALVCMVYFHVIFDMKEFFNYPVSYGTGVNYVIGKIAVVLFTFIAGISCQLSRSNLKRGLKILGAAMLITAVSYIFTPDYAIVYGVLHFLGTCILLLYPAARKLNPVLLAVLGTAVIALGSVVNRVTVGHNYFFFLGITSSSFRSGDYYPLIPWSGIFFYGMALAKVLYKEKKSIFPFNPGNNIISIAGRHTLLVYLLHQPVILAVLKLIDIML